MTGVRMRFLRTVLLATALTTSGCLMENEPHTDRIVPVRFESDSKRMADVHVRRTLAALPPGLEIEHDGGQSPAAPCGSAEGPKALKGTYNLDIGYYVRGIAPDQYPETARSILAFWRQNGYQVTETRSDPKTHRFRIRATSPKDGFSVMVFDNTSPALVVVSTSPCTRRPVTPVPTPR